MVFGFELGPYAPRVNEDIVWSKQGSRRVAKKKKKKSLFCKFCTGQEPGREGTVTATAGQGY